MRKQDRLSVSMTADQIGDLRAEAQRLGISVGDVLRRVLDEHRGVAPWDARRRPKPARPDGTAAAS